MVYGRPGKAGHPSKPYDGKTGGERQFHSVSWGHHGAGKEVNRRPRREQRGDKIQGWKKLELQFADSSCKQVQESANSCKFSEGRMTGEQGDSDKVRRKEVH